jgi:hypothetical protein
MIPPASARPSHYLRASTHPPSSRTSSPSLRLGQDEPYIPHVPQRGQHPPARLAFGDKRFDFLNGDLVRFSRVETRPPEVEQNHFALLRKLPWVPKHLTRDTLSHETHVELFADSQQQGPGKLRFVARSYTDTNGQQHILTMHLDKGIPEYITLLRPNQLVHMEHPDLRLIDLYDKSHPLYTEAYKPHISLGPQHAYTLQLVNQRQTLALVKHYDHKDPNISEVLDRFSIPVHHLEATEAKALYPHLDHRLMAFSTDAHLNAEGFPKLHVPSSVTERLDETLAAPVPRIKGITQRAAGWLATAAAGVSMLCTYLIMDYKRPQSHNTKHVQNRNHSPAAQAK